MASTIKLKNSTTAGNTPSSLETGEVAINVADGNLFYGSASAVLQNFVVDELEVKGNLTAQQYIVSSSVTYTTQSFSSGSTAFGDSADDTHVFTGNITASGNISASGTIVGSNLSGTNTGDQDLSTYALITNVVANSSTSSFVTAAQTSSFLTAADTGSLITAAQTSSFVTAAQTSSFVTAAQTSSFLTAADTGSLITAAQTSSFLTTVAFGDVTSKPTLISSSAQIADVTLTTAAQTNITQVGNLQSLAMDGTIDMNGETLNLNAGEIDNGASIKSLVFGSTTDADLTITSDGNITFKLDDDNDETGQSFSFKNDDTEIANLDESGNLQLDGNITASGNISSSGTVIAATLDAAAVSDTLAAAIVAEIDNDEIPVAKLAEDSISGVTLGGNLNNLTVDNATLQLDSGTTYNGSAAKTISIKDGGVDSDALAADITVTGDLTVGGSIIHNGDTDTKIVFGTNDVKIQAGNTSVFESSVTGSVLPNVHQNIFDTGSVALNENGAFGDIVKFGNSSTVAGGLYFLNSEGTWTLTNADSISKGASASLAVAVGTNSTTHGMCIRGFVNPFADPTDAPIGGQVFMSDTAQGRITGSAPKDTGDIVRVVGHRYGTDLVYFNPSNDFIVHA